MVAAEVAAKTGPWISTSAFSSPIYTVSAGQPLVRVALENPEPHLREAFAAVPLPLGARPATGSDAQLTLWQPATDRLWEFWRLRAGADGWRASWGGAMDHVSEDPGYFAADSWPGADAHWGATSTSLPLVAGLITLQDLRQGRIDHALALGLPQVASTFMWPAQRTDGTASGPSAIPAGTRFRVSPRLDLSKLSLPPLARMLAEAAQRYGMVVRDTSGIVDFYGEDPAPTASHPYRSLLGGQFPWQVIARFPWNALQMLSPSEQGH
jgi:hypothetical protein